MDREEVEVNKYVRKNKLGQYSAILTEQAWTIKGLLHSCEAKLRELLLAGQKREIPSHPSFPHG